jgi:hypothetical protein
MRLAFLNRFLRVLELLEEISDFAAFVGAPMGVSIFVCWVSYNALLWGSCDIPWAAILAGASAMTVYTLAKKPDA